MTTLTVCMPVYNAEAYLSSAVDSILGQTHTDFEFLIIDDGSTDNSAHIIERYGDQRIRLIRQENRGIARTLNRMIDEARTNWLVRHDADDIAYPDRLATIAGYVERYPEAGAFYSEADYFQGDTSLGRFRTTACSPLVLRSYTSAGYLLSICHPSVTLSKEKVLSIGKYREIPHVEDIDLWARMSLKHDMVYMKEVCIKMRLHEQSVSSKNLEEQALLTAYVQYLLISSLWGREPAPLNIVRYALSKMIDAKKFRSKAQIRAAGMKAAQRNYLGALVAVMGAVLASPRFALNRVTMNMIHRQTAVVNGIGPLQFASLADDLWPTDTEGLSRDQI